MVETRALVAQMPLVRRARGFRLYDMSGRRIIDMYLSGGAAFLGHRGAGTLRESKEVLSRGLGTGMRSVHTARLAKALARLLPSHPFARVFSCLHTALDAVAVFQGIRTDAAEIVDPAVGPCPAASLVSFWRPLLPPDAEPEAEVLLPILPSEGVCVACFRDDPGERVSGDLVSPHLAAAAARGVADLLAGNASSERAQISHEVACAIAGSPTWNLRGPYLSVRADAQTYAAVFSAFLGAGVLLSPFFPGPSILPAEASAGEMALLKRLLAATPEKK